MSGTLFVVATPIGNLEDISARALRVLREVAVIAAEDTRRTAHLLARYAISTPTTSLHEHNEHRKTAVLMERLERGDHIALVSDAGTPVVSDPGRLLVQAAVAAGIRVESVPGPSAVMAALAASGFAGDAFTFLGFPPAKGTARTKWLNDLKSAGRTVVFFEAPHRLTLSLGEIAELMPSVSVSVSKELTKTHEKSVNGPIEVVLVGLKAPLGEYTVVVDVGQWTHTGKHEAAGVPLDEALRDEFGRMTSAAGTTRRMAIAQLARKYRLPANRVYAAIEKSKT